MRIKSYQIFVVAITTVAGIAVAASESSDIISLADSLEPLKTAFNADSAKPRLIAILSPT